MCFKPKRLIVKFYSKVAEDKAGKPVLEEANTDDISLIEFIRNIDSSAKDTCPNEDCKRQKWHHTDFYYHGNGCVQIRY